MTTLSLGPESLNCVLIHALFVPLQHCEGLCVSVYMGHPSGPWDQGETERGREESLGHRVVQGKTAPRRNHRRGSRKCLVLNSHLVHKHVHKKWVRADKAGIRKTFGWTPSPGHSPGDPEEGSPRLMHVTISVFLSGWPHRGSPEKRREVVN